MINMIWSAGVLARNSVSCKRLTRIHARFFIFDRINMINMIWRASVPTSRLPLCGRMVSGFHCGAPGGASVCLPADEQTLVPSFGSGHDASL